MMKFSNIGIWFSLLKSWIIDDLGLYWLLIVEISFKFYNRRVGPTWEEPFANKKGLALLKEYYRIGFADKTIAGSVSTRYNPPDI